MELSVQFFKRLIVGLLATLILIPILLSIYFGTTARRGKEQSQQLQDQVWQLQASLSAALNAARQTDADAADSVYPANVTDAAAPALSPAALAYQTLFPDLRSTAYAADRWQRQDKTVYLTFDGGPSAQTAEILDILDEAGIKATFFMIAGGNENSLNLLEEIARRGHTLGVHSYSDSYTKVYQSVESYLTDFQAAYDLIADRTGVAPVLFRFPGGSINAYNGTIYQQLIAEMTRRGFTYYDWDVVGDASNTDAASIKRAVLNGIHGKSRSIVLMHDTANRRATTEALPGIISALQEQGYTFAPLTPEVEPVRFHYTD